MTHYDDQGRPEPPIAAGEVDAALGFLDFQRATLAWKCAGADVDAMQATVGLSTMTLGGLLKHLALVEDYWFSERLLGHDAHEPWSAIDWEADPDWEWHSAADDTPDALRALWQDAVERSRGHTAAAMADGGFGRLAAVPSRDGSTPNLRWIVLHMIEEYARHNGHADLLREAADGGAIGE